MLLSLSNKRFTLSLPIFAEAPQQASNKHSCQKQLSYHRQALPTQQRGPPFLSLKLQDLAVHQFSSQNSRACWQNGRTEVLPDTYEPAEPIAHRAKLFLKADLDSLG